MKTAIAVLNYNMPEATLRWWNHIQDHRHFWVIDNGSKKFNKTFIEPQIAMGKNLGTALGLIHGAEILQSHGYERVWFISTSTAPITENSLELLESAWEDKTVLIVPAFVGESDSWPHQDLMWNETEKPVETWCGQFGLWDLKWFISHADKRFTETWGMDFDMGFRARRSGKKIVLHHGVRVGLNEYAGYKDKRYNITRQQRNARADKQMREVLTLKYGSDWPKRILPFKHWDKI